MPNKIRVFVRVSAVFFIDATVEKYTDMVESAASDIAFIFSILILLRSANRCSSVSVATTLHAGRQRNLFSVPVRGRNMYVVYHIERGPR